MTKSGPWWGGGSLIAAYNRIWTNIGFQRRGGRVIIYNPPVIISLLPNKVYCTHFGTPPPHTQTQTRKSLYDRGTESVFLHFYSMHNKGHILLRHILNIFCSNNVNKTTRSNGLVFSKHISLEQGYFQEFSKLKSSILFNFCVVFDNILRIRTQSIKSAAFSSNNLGFPLFSQSYWYPEHWEKGETTNYLSKKASDIQ